MSVPRSGSGLRPIFAVFCWYVVPLRVTVRGSISKFFIDGWGAPGGRALICGQGLRNQGAFLACGAAIGAMSSGGFFTLNVDDRPVNRISG